MDQKPRPGYGEPHPDLAALLGRMTAVARDRVVWPGMFTVDIAAYPTPTALPDEMVTSVRCIVRVDGRVVLCHAPDEDHIWPGGRREAGETYQQTARREVYEETGWLIEPDDLRPLGFLHYHLPDPVPADHPFPHPDFLQVVYSAVARDRADQRPAEWTDLAGWERSHRLLTLDELAAAQLTAVQRAFLAVLPDNLGG